MAFLEKFFINKIKQRIKKNGKCRVAFYVFEIAKWKTDSLYRLLETNPKFEPFIVLGIPAGRRKLLSKKELKERFYKQMKYFRDRGLKIFLGYSLRWDKPYPLKKFKPDIVFYQQHVGICHMNRPKKVNHYALTAYIPYNVPNYGNTQYDYNLFCTRLYRFYTLNEDLKEYYIKTHDTPIKNIVVTGHTALDYFYLNKDKKTENKYVIYAPHFSIMHPAVENLFYYSTFQLYGDIILDFAQKHPEISWVFKPHPNLIETLKKMNVPKECIDTYYNEWKKIGMVCTSSEYQELFANSKAMITDCGSFLTEYFCTGKPLLHLISPFSVNWACDAMKPMFDSFYKIHNKQDLFTEINRVIINGDDYKQQERICVSKNLAFTEQYAAKNIMNDLNDLFIPGSQKAS